MTRFTDGPELTLSDLRQSLIPSIVDKVRDLAGICGLSGYQFMFNDLQKDPKNRLPETDETAFRLIDLGRTMVDPNPASKEGDSKIPSAYTYLGQFIDHDLTRQIRLPGDGLKSCMRPLSDEMIVLLTNARSPSFDLDCVYGPPTEPGTPPYSIPRDGEKLVIRRAQDGPPFSDLPRVDTPIHYALIGDRRNDEHFIISQMHVAFLRAHNALVDSKMSFETAQTALRRIYQYIVVNDYLPRIADPVIVKEVLSGALNVFNSANVSIPLEFSVAAFRTGHSMIRNVYNYNKNLEDIGVVDLFLPGPLVEFRQILGSWVIDWPRFFDGTNVARLLSPKLAPNLTRFVDTKTGFDLASVDLLKGYLCRLPTGEAVAKHLGITPMSFKDIAKVTTPEQQRALTYGGFRNRTPLWFYLLCEAATTKTGRLGRVGSIIVASVIIGLIRKSADSYLHISGWTPFDDDPVFNLDHLFRFAGVLPNN